MCRFLLYTGPPVTLSSLLVEPCNSLIHQSFHSYESDDPLNADGFGIAWYASKIAAEPGLFRATSPAWSNRNLRSLSRVTESKCILAHVRAATPGLVVSESNCHPFVCGPITFMHNGDVGDFQAVRRQLLESLSDRSFQSIQGSTDSEHVFAVLLDELGADVGTVGIDVLVAAVRRTIARIDSLVHKYSAQTPSYLNLAVTDGRCAVVSRFVTGGRSDAASLHYSTGSRYECHEGVCRMRSTTPGEHAVIVCSEPLSRDEGWQEVPVNHLVVIGSDRSVRIDPV